MLALFVMPGTSATSHNAIILRSGDPKKESLNCGVAGSSGIPRRWRRALIQRKTHIRLYELLAVTVALRTFANELRGRIIIAFIDTTCALGMIIRSATRKYDANGILHHVWLGLAMLGVHAEWQRVPSKLNVADGPSRECFTDVLALGLAWRTAQWGARLL